MEGLKVENQTEEITLAELTVYTPGDFDLDSALKSKGYDCDFDEYIRCSLEEADLAIDAGIDVDR
jgi:hypothetical protein